MFGEHADTGAMRVPRGRDDRVRYDRDRVPAEVLILDAGLAVACLGLVAALRPLPLLGLATGRRGVVALLVGLATAGLAVVLPVRPVTLAGPAMRLDAVIPEYQFGESHEILVHAPRARVWSAVLEVTPDEIRLFRALTWLRSPHFGPAPEGILNPGHGPLLRSALDGGFVELAREDGIEIVLGTLVSGGDAPPRTPDDVLRGEGTGLVRAVMNFHLTHEPDGVRLRTQTRVDATSPDAASRFAIYWRAIYPGSALIRRMWLAAIKRRAEGNR